MPSSSEQECVGSESVHKWALAIIIIFGLVFVGTIVAMVITCYRRKIGNDQDREVGEIVMPLSLQSSVLNEDYDTMSNRQRSKNRLSMSNHE